MRFLAATKGRERDMVLKEKGRQGRSAAVRKRKAEERAALTLSLNVEKCQECGSSDDFVEDYSSGDLVCTRCGAVGQGGGLAFSCFAFTHNPNSSKPYQKVVHFRQRISQLLCRDPEQDEEKVEKLRVYISANQALLGSPNFYGIKTFSMICRKVGISPKLASHWMQLRKRLELEPSCSPPPSAKLLHRITMRYICIANCFESTLKKRKGEEANSPLKRNNVINLNFSIIMLIRIESEEEFERLAKFFPQLISQNQPGINNRRWEIILEECRKKYQRFADPLRGEPFEFDWPYKPILVEDLVKHFYFFH